MNAIKAKPLTASAFAPYGDVIEIAGDPTVVINQGQCDRYSDLAKLAFGSGQAGISLFKSKICTLPYELNMVERHPEGSQAFLPMSQCSFLIIVATDKHGTPIDPMAFISSPGQAVNLHKGTWHGVLTPLEEPGLFAVVDRIGAGSNLEEHYFDQPYIVERS